MNQPRVTWGADGWAETDGWVLAHSSDPLSGEHRLSQDVWVSRGTGLPACAHLDAPPLAAQGKACIWQEDCWVLVDDLRGQTAYHKQSRQPEVISTLGALPPAFTLLSPDSQFAIWDEEAVAWTRDFAAEQLWQKQQAEFQHTALMAEANQRIAVLGDAIELGMATSAEQTSYTAWRQYRVELSRLDLTLQPISWPSKPITVV